MADCLSVQAHQTSSRDRSGLSVGQPDKLAVLPHAPPAVLLAASPPAILG